LAEALAGQASTAFAVFRATKRRPIALLRAALSASACHAEARPRPLCPNRGRSSGDLKAKGAGVRKGTSPQLLTAIVALVDAT
jgi:hypothetical protein